MKNQKLLAIVLCGAVLGGCSLLEGSDDPEDQGPRDPGTPQEQVESMKAEEHANRPVDEEISN